MESTDMDTPFEPENDEGNIEYKQQLLGVSPEKLQKLVTQMQYRLREGEGECVYVLGVADNGDLVGLSECDLAASLDTLRQLAQQCECCLVPVSTMKVTGTDPPRYIVQVIVREDNDTDYIDLRVAILGSVDCAKSTMLGVLVSGELDDGRGKARLQVFNHPHEVSSGRTSSQALHIIGFDSRGNIVDSGGEKMRKRSWPDITRQSTKVVTFIDLPGHERYLTTTMSGMIGSKPDYAIVMVAGNKGVNHMTREHILLCLALQVPFVVVVSKIDLEPTVVQETMSGLRKLLKLPGVRKTPLVLHKDEDLPVCMEHIKTGHLTPIVKVSFKTGAGLAMLKKLLNCLQPRTCSSKLSAQPLHMSVIESFKVKGLGGAVLHCFLNRGEVQVGQDILLGPNKNGEYREAKVRSIHCKRSLVSKVGAGKHVCINVKVARKHIHRGMAVLAKGGLEGDQCVWEFQAELKIFRTHHTTIKVGYEPVLHLENIKQPAKILDIQSSSGSILRAGQRAVVTMRFKVRPVYVTVGSVFVFREEKTRGMGTVVKIY